MCVFELFAPRRSHARLVRARSRTNRTRVASFRLPVFRVRVLAETCDSQQGTLGPLTSHNKRNAADTRPRRFGTGNGPMGKHIPRGEAELAKQGASGVCPHRLKKATIPYSQSHRNEAAFHTDCSAARGAHFSQAVRTPLPRCVYQPVGNREQGREAQWGSIFPEAKPSLRCKAGCVLTACQKRIGRECGTSI